ncbi:glycosyltransferase family 2 protein [Candidatus Kapaibacterium sp.]
MNGTEIILLAFLTIYSYIFYPIILLFLSKLIPHRIVPPAEYYPEITVIIAAYNEEELIAGALNSVLNSDYPKDKLNIIVGSDGSEDKTNEIVESFSYNNSNVKLIKVSRGGKNNLLNNIVPSAQTDIILFMDADVRLNTNTIKNLVVYFANPKVGGVIASQTVVGDGKTENAGSQGDSVYHRYEEKIRILEGEIGSNVNSLGYFYGIRKDLFRNIPNNLVCDDLHNIYCVLESKNRLLFAKDAKAYEVRPKSLSNEFHRRVRAVAGGWATVSYHKKLLSAHDYGMTAFFIWSHKIFRWLSPIFLILLGVTSIFSNYSMMIFYLFVIPQIMLYGFAIIGWIFEKLNIPFTKLRIFLFFVSMNYSSLLGLFRFLSKRQNAIWNREGFNS